jgi:hypothetical protein
MPKSTSRSKSRPKKRASSAAKRMSDYRARLRAAGLRPVQLWLPDTRDPKFIAACREQARRLAAGDPAGVEMMEFIEATSDWPEP